MQGTVNISMNTALKKVLIGLVRVYRIVISPLFPPCCRYYPTCSAYAVQAIRMHGPIPGAWLALKRVARCHPWAPGGLDPVPARASGSAPGKSSTREGDERGRGALS